MRLNAFAPAKVNLFLHVGAVEAADGLHPVSSLMVFADIGDRLGIEASDAPEFMLDGPMSEGLEDCDPADNLVIRARDLLLAHLRRPTPPFRLLLTKMLPTAAGLGGGGICLISDPAKGVREYDFLPPMDSKLYCSSCFKR